MKLTDKQCEVLRFAAKKEAYLENPTTDFRKAEAELIANHLIYRHDVDGVDTLYLTDAGQQVLDNLPKD